MKEESHIGCVCVSEPGSALQLASCWTLTSVHTTSDDADAAHSRNDPASLPL